MGTREAFFAFLSDQRGSASLEFVIWVPFFMLLLMLMVDVSTIYFNQTQMMHVSRDAARRMSMGQLEPETLTAFVQGHLTNAVTVTNCSIDETACVRISRPFENMAIFGNAFTSLIGRDMSASTSMRVEPGI